MTGQASPRHDLAERVALVTGGGRGLGEAICRSLSEAGATVVVADLDEERAAAVARCGRGFALRLDVGQDEQVRGAVDQVVRELGHLDVLINNAGIDYTLPLSELTVEQWDRVMATNLRGPFLMTKHALPHLIRSRKGHVVNIASTAAKRCWPNAAAYHASKWGLLGLSHALCSELRAKAVKVTAIVTGGMRTPFLLDRFPDLDPAKLQDPKHVAEVVRFVLAQPEQTLLPEVMVMPLQETSWP